MIVNNTLRGMSRQVWRDLAYFPGRFATAWRIGAMTALMSFIAMFYGIPESAISCYLILFVMKPDGLVSMVMGFAIIILVTLVVGFIILILPYTLESIPLRMAVLISSSFFFLWLGSASQLGEVGSIVALVIAFIMGLIGVAPNGELATRAVLYAWLMVASPMLLLIAFNLFIGRSPLLILFNTVAMRLRLAAVALRDPNTIHLRQIRVLLAEGQSDDDQRAMLIRLFHLGKRVQRDWVSAALINSYRLLLAISELGDKLSPDQREEMAQWCSDAAALLDKKQLPSVPQFQHANSGEIANSLLAIAHPTDEPLPVLSKIPFLSPDALSNPNHCYFALKTTLASVLCYIIYTVMDWQDIHTAMITCYVAVLGTTGETVHKLTLRIVGCLIGASIGILSLVFIIPGMSGIGELMILVFAVLLLSAWVSTGNERISYGGIQIGLAFLLTVLHGFAPSSDLDPATGRIMGILLGNLIIYIIFSLIWPMAIVESVRERIRTVLHDIGELAAIPNDQRMRTTMQSTRVEQGISGAQEALRLMPFEPKHLRPSAQEFQRLNKTLFMLDETCRSLFVPIARAPNAVARFQALRLDEASVPIPPGEQTDESSQTAPASDARVLRNLTRLEGLLKWPR